MPHAGFVHLHVHSAYSLLKGSIKIAKLGELAKADRQPALALTDTDNMFGALEFSDKMAGYGIQPIVGLELAIDFGDQDPNARSAHAASSSRVVLLAARDSAHANAAGSARRSRGSQPEPCLARTGLTRRGLSPPHAAGGPPRRSGAVGA